MEAVGVVHQVYACSWGIQDPGFILGRNQIKILKVQSGVRTLLKKHHPSLGLRCTAHGQQVIFLPFCDFGKFLTELKLGKPPPWDPLDLPLHTDLNLSLFSMMGNGIFDAAI